VNDEHDRQCVRKNILLELHLTIDGDQHIELNVLVDLYRAGTAVLYVKLPLASSSRTAKALS